MSEYKKMMLKIEKKLKSIFKDGIKNNNFLTCLHLKQKIKN